MLEMRCYEALRKIKAVLEDESLTDAACFQKIEEIINILRKSEAMAVAAMISRHTSCRLSAVYTGFSWICPRKTCQTCGIIKEDK